MSRKRKLEHHDHEDGVRSTSDRVNTEVAALLAAAFSQLKMPACVLTSGQLHQLLRDPVSRKKGAAAAEMLKLKAQPRLAPGVYSSDFAIKLFHKYIKPSTRHVASGDNGGLDSTEAVAGVLVAAMQHELASTTDPKQYRHILKVTQPETSATDKPHSLHRDRMLFHTREFAQLTGEYEKQGSKLTFLYRDDAIVVVDKPANVLSVDGNDAQDISIQQRIRSMCLDARMVHRLDYETSGILAIAMTKTAAQHLNAQFRARTVKKTYYARVLGHVEEEEGTIELAMGPHATEKLVQVVYQDREADKETSPLWTKTHWKRVATTKVDGNADGDSTLMQLKPVTGKTHQLRVHMQHLGHPILGDSLYSPERVRHKAPRLCLHAAKLELLHPVTNQELTFESPCPF
uniref:Pseudouridine synthase RsuA/RluA-like domain-containing protein n=1 Tax=Globisporangium ultimum (strain ATCC 200006 / CBS 805.95 / DAOM BR144) TaxID=431595 RepID=K3WNU1_GLOUD